MNSVALLVERGGCGGLRGFPRPTRGPGNNYPMPNGCRRAAGRRRAAPANPRAPADLPCGRRVLPPDAPQDDFVPSLTSLHQVKSIPTVPSLETLSEGTGDLALESIPTAVIIG